MHFYFLGNTPALSLLELSSVIPNTYHSLTAKVVSSASLSDPALLSRLGGLRKAARVVAQGPRAEVRELLAASLRTLPHKNVAITDYSQLNLSRRDLHDLKKGAGRPLRFVSMDTTEHELILLAHQHVAELNLLPLPSGEVALALTDWIFDAEDWIARDRNKPYRDIKRGMLPAKLARIMANLALGQTGASSLYDPFCGTGTVLAEAALLNVPTLYGSDTFGAAVTGTEANLRWISSHYHLENTHFQIQVADAPHPPFADFDAVATEPYMGPLLDDRYPLPLPKIKDIARGLDKLYRGSLKAWHSRLRPAGRVVMCIPTFAVYGQHIPTISIDTLTALGYNYISSVAYGKPGATVIRNITILEKN